MWTYSSSNNAIKPTSTLSGAMGKALYVDLMVDRVPIKATVDTGAQSNIISRSLWCNIAHHRSLTGQHLTHFGATFCKSMTKIGRGQATVHRCTRTIKAIYFCCS